MAKHDSCDPPPYPPPDHLPRDSPPPYSRTSSLRESVASTAVSDDSLVHSPTDSVIVDRSAGNGSVQRMSIFVQSFLRPCQAPRLIDVSSTTQSAAIPASLDIVVMVVGENVDPFLTLGKRLARDGHRVRVAALQQHEEQVRRKGLDFYPVRSTGDLSQAADGPQTRVMLLDQYTSCWEACIASLDANDNSSSSSSSSSVTSQPFMADAIIASPLAHAHIHCAQRLSVPLHIMSSTPCWPTREFPHPEAQSITQIDDPGLLNMLTYAMLEESVWNRITEPVNRFRQLLGLPALSSELAGRLLQDCNVPHTFFCSPRLYPRPRDWPSWVEITGYPLDCSASSPINKALDNFCQSGPLVYLALDEQAVVNRSQLTQAVHQVSQHHGLRLILSPSCQSLLPLGNNIIVSDEEAWILSRVDIAVHHATAHSTAITLQSGTPSVTIPLACRPDQHDRAVAIAKAGAGAAPLPEAAVCPTTLSQAIEFGLSPGLRQNMQPPADPSASLEEVLRCVSRWIAPRLKLCTLTGDLAVYRVQESGRELSAAAAAVLIANQRLKPADLINLPIHVYDVKAEPTAAKYRGAVANAARDIVNASDLVSKLPGLQRNTGAKRDVVEEIGVGTARLFGNIALLPFTTTALAVNSVLIGVKSARAMYKQDGPQGQADPDRKTQVDWRAFIDELQTQRGGQDPRVQEKEFCKAVLDKFK
ncbi:hypothetical protein ASPZODRAFT_132374 [Penicilliopsis zonata CBS 506.65]|uniref:Uncharacterized protein n=1 Tax=Penicilliopsis zonata CBS 506.65 TaxID=1073090 RepID=A0A1L9SJP5_9EURO|nr:hypothetical protein ASPZODRAFT_132374 [Penicilliopsis zonata CBS 506.65]OJJ47387.1 hypothetical protein ASPZODRAFT_132374 [Penicilliopsis zonata CBS 506.65]